MTVNPQDLTSVFVYGTLCRGQSNESLWPYPPQTIQIAFVHGRLFDLGPYPAMTPGEHWVRGELWTLRIEQMKETLAALDKLEECHGRAEDLYRRVVVECHLQRESRTSTPAFTYFYCRELAATSEIEPDDDAVCSWPIVHGQIVPDVLG